MESQLQGLNALVMVELKKLIRDPMNLVVMLLMPVGLTLIFYLALGNVYNDYYPVPGMNHFDYLLPGVMGYAVIYMGMMVALSLTEYRKNGVLSRVETAPVSVGTYLGSHIIANMVIATFQGLIVLLVAWLLGFKPQGGLVGILLVVFFLAILGVTAVGLGMITAAIAKDSGAASGLSVIFILPMMMFGALLAVFNETTRTIARFTPNFYVTDSLSLILHEGRVSDPRIWQNLLTLIGITLVVVIVGINLFSKTAFRTIDAATSVAAERKPARLFFVDHWRAMLAILVVLHHISLVYGASLQGYYYVEPPFNNPKAFTNLLVFALLNQGWFMGAFFLISGYFTPGSFDRKGAGAFIKDKLIHLGIPLLVFYFVLSPIAFIGYYLMPAEMTGISTQLTWSSFWKAYPNFTGLGPLWFVAMLLIFNLGYAFWSGLTSRKNAESQPVSSTPSYLGIGIFILALAGVSYLWRMMIPLGKSVWQFPTLAYLPQYLSFFVIGTIAYRKDWFRRVPESMGAITFVLAILAVVFLFPLAFSGQMFSLELSEALDNSMGNGHWQSAIYALWDSTFAVGISLGLLVFFRRSFNRQGWFGQFLSQQSYAVYLIHIPIVVFIAYAMRGIVVGSLLKFGLASLVIIPICFIAGALIRKIPGVAQIL
jgi:ABC-type multidrug transport system permease subunit/peptidoglycan/LPS O-acetylase OafA/YrhL